MITAHIGPNGRLGNQMFQYAALMGIATKQNLDWGIDRRYGNSLTWKEFPIDNTFHAMTVDKAFNLSCKDCVPGEYKFAIENSPNEFHFQEKFFHTGDNVCLRGYFQTHRYFEHIEDRVRREFTFKPEIIEEAKKYLRPDRETVSIHVRRGDYVQNTWHGLCDETYYRRAIEENFLDKLYDFVYITDDPVFLGQKIRPSDSVRLCTANNQFVEMCLMSLCQHNIIANSTFSWWGSWLNSNPNKKVIAPSVWFRQHLAEANISDLYQKNWIII